jgi:molybdate transport system substrate-binding protein
MTRTPGKHPSGMTRYYRPVRALIFSLLIALPAVAEEVDVLAAASLTDVLQEIAANYERTSGDRIVFNFGASSMLARQIELGAPADLFASADEAKMDALQRRDLIDPKTRVSLLSNTLVIVSNMKLSDPRQLVNVKSIALAEPSSVPAGIYARQYLTKIGIWRRVEKKIIPTDNVRSALAAVKSGNVDAAIVYKTDAKQFMLEIKDGPPISYPFAVVRDAKHARAAKRFLTYLASKPARDVFVRHGFLVK